MESYQNTGYFLTVYTPLSQHLARQSSRTQVFLTLPSQVFNLTPLTKLEFRPPRSGEAQSDLVKMSLLRNQVFFNICIILFLECVVKGFVLMLILFLVKKYFRSKRARKRILQISKLSSQDDTFVAYGVITTIRQVASA